MSRVEISGYIQIVVGIIGIVLTLLTAPTILDAFGSIASGKEMPVEFANASGVIRIFCVLFILFILLLLVVMGMAITLSTIFKALGASNPTLASLLGVIGIVSLALTATLAVLGVRFWVPGAVGTLGLFVMSFVACADDDQYGNVAGTAIAFLLLFFVTGLGTLMTMAG